MSDFNDGKWHGWNGGECPVHPKTVVEVVYFKPILIAGAIYYRRSGQAKTIWSEDPDTICAFRVVKEYREPRDYWFVLDPEPRGRFSRGPLVGKLHAEIPVAGTSAIHLREVIE